MKTYSQFLFEKVIINPNEILDSIKAKPVQSGDVFDINTDNYSDLEILYNDDRFNEKLKDKGYKKDKLELSKEYQTFLINSLIMKYFLVFKETQTELEKPKYIFIQIKEQGKWGEIGLYKVGDQMKNFYDLLTNKTIEITDKSGKNYIYKTTNGGMDWTLQNVESQNDTYRKVMRSEEINQVLKSTLARVEEID